MPKEAELKSMQFPPFTSLARRTFSEFFLHFHYFVKKILSLLRWPTVNHNGHGASKRKGGLWNLSICQRASAHVFLRSRHRPKNLVQFLHFRKHFHNFKYDNFLFGKTPRIIHVCLAFVYLFLFPERKGLDEKRGSSNIGS